MMNERLLTSPDQIPLPYMAAQQQKMLRIMSLVIIPISTVVALFLPSGLTLYFFLSSILHTTQAWLTHQQWFRRMVGLRPLTKPVETGDMSWQAPRVIDVSVPRVAGVQRAAAPTSETMFGSLKTTLADAREKLEERANKGAAERAGKAARDYDEKRALEEKEKLVARLQRRRFKDERY